MSKNNQMLGLHAEVNVCVYVLWACVLKECLFSCDPLSRELPPFVQWWNVAVTCVIGCTFECILELPTCFSSHERRAQDFDVSGRSGHVGVCLCIKDDVIHRQTRTCRERLLTSKLCGRRSCDEQHAGNSKLHSEAHPGTHD